MDRYHKWRRDGAAGGRGGRRELHGEKTSTEHEVFTSVED